MMMLHLSSFAKALYFLSLAHDIGGFDAKLREGTAESLLENKWGETLHRTSSTLRRGVTSLTKKMYARLLQQDACSHLVEATSCESHENPSCLPKVAGGWGEQRKRIIYFY
jgi:hypothetical protein